MVGDFFPITEIGTLGCFVKGIIFFYFLLLESLEIYICTFGGIDCLIDSGLASDVLDTADKSCSPVL